MGHVVCLQKSATRVQGARVWAVCFPAKESDSNGVQGRSEDVERQFTMVWLAKPAVMEAVEGTLRV